MSDKPTLSVITDEIAPTLDEVLIFARHERLACLEVRQIDGINFMALPESKLREAAMRIADAGLSVTALTTPLLKWPAPGQPFLMRGDQFGFDPQSRTTAEHFRHAADAAHIFGTRCLRIFSYLAHDGFGQRELDHDIAALLHLADREDLILLMENEPVCNIRSISALLDFLRSWNHSRLRCLLDIGNIYGAGGAVTPAEIAAIMPFVPYMHIKDYHVGNRRHAILGQGSVPYARILPACIAAAGEPLVLSLEVHVAGGAGASLTALRRLVEDAASRTSP